MAVYVLHFDPPYKQAKHYIGYTRIGKRRIERHIAGHGSPLIRAAVAAGCTIIIAHWYRDGTRAFERQLKNKKSTPRWCDCCNKEHFNGTSTSNEK